MKKIKISKSIKIITIIILFIMSIISTYSISKFVLNKKFEAEQKTSSVTINELKHQIKQYQDQVSGFINTQKEIRSYVNELVELLYARESYLSTEGIGGYGGDLKLNEQTPLFQLKEVISNLQDDQQAMEMVKNYLVARRQFAESFPFIWPVPGGVPRISSGYGVRANEEVGNIQGLNNRPKGGIHFHAGIDIPGHMGDLIQATADGRIIWINKKNPVYGKVIIIQHSYGFQTLYGHLSKVNVKQGQYVKRGDIIGLMGNGGESSGVHLHYEIKKDGYHINPMDLLGMNY